jgi:hypothetical protein
LSTLAGFTFTRSIEKMEVAKGDSFGKDSIPIVETFKQHVDFRDITSEIMAAAIAGSSATGTILGISKEAQVIASTSVTLAQQPLKVAGATLAPITIVDQNGRTFKQLATGTPATGEFVDTGASKIITVAAADNTLTIYVTYYYTGAGGTTVSTSPSSIPGSIKTMFAGKIWSTRTGAFTGSLVFVAKKAQPVGDMTVGGSVGDVGTSGIDFDLGVDVASDIQVCFPN